MLNLLDHVDDLVKGKAKKGQRRSSEWRKLRNQYLFYNPFCACCSGTKRLRVHHIKPFHTHPHLELEWSNLITLCERKKVLNCHLIIGHLKRWNTINVDCLEDVKIWNMKLG